MSAGDFAQRLRPVLADAVDARGFLLDDVTVRQAGRRKLVTVVVDSESPAGVGLDDIAVLSREVSAALDGVPDVLAGPYTLEVTSPGIDRPLTEQRHWRRAHTKLVALRLADGTAGKARVGVAGAHDVRLLIDGEPRSVAYADIERAVIEVEFNQPPAKELAILEGQDVVERSTIDGRCTDAGAAERATGKDSSKDLTKDSKEESR